MNLQNNSNEMKTIVETFVIEETAELIYDAEKLEEWNGYVQSLGLQGQTKIVQKEKSPIPFMHIKTSLKNVFETLCPCKVAVEEYSMTPIPVEILSLLQLCKQELYFDKIQIWYDDKNPDPVCVGSTFGTWYCQNNECRINNPQKTKVEAQIIMDANGWNKYQPYGTNEQIYLLGKWADVKHSFDELKEMAIKRYTEGRVNELKKQIKEAERGLVDIETDAFDKFN